MRSNEPHEPDRLLIEDAVAAQIQLCDPQQELKGADFHDTLLEVADKVYACMEDEQRADLDDEDRAFIERRVRKLVRLALASDQEALPQLRFDKFDRVVCNIGGDRRWASGTVQALHEDDPADPTGQTRLAYVVKIDDPNARLVSVPDDDYTLCRAEVCFGQRAGALWFTLFCLPPRQRGASRRFSPGERVACAVEDETNDFSLWAAGTVLSSNVSVEADATAMLPDRDWSGAAGTVPYSVELDSGVKVLVHQDVHWLIRDLALQPAGPRQMPGGVRSLARLEKRQKGDAWQAIDHSTRQVRSCAAPEESSEDEDSGGG